MPDKGGQLDCFCSVFFNFDTFKTALFDKCSAAQLISSRSQSNLPTRFVLDYFHFLLIQTTLTKVQTILSTISKCLLNERLVCGLIDKFQKMLYNSQ